MSRYLSVLFIVFIVGVLLVNLWFFFDFSRPVTSDTSDDDLWRRGEYTTMATADAYDFRTIAARLKLGDIDKVTKNISSLDLLDTPVWWQDIVKALLLRSKEDFIGAEHILSQTRNDTPVIQSLLLALRAQFFCEQRQWTECEILAEDSVKLDPLSPYGLLLGAQARTMQGDHTTAKDLRLRAEKLGAVLSDTVRMYRGRTFFYALRERAETDLLAVVDHPEYAPDALLFLGRISLEDEQYQQALDRFTRADRYQDAKDIKFRQADLWRGRVFVAMGQYREALEAYRLGYEKNATAVELMTDMLIPASHLSDIPTLASLEQAIAASVGDSVGSHHLAATRFLQIKNISLARRYLDLGSGFIALIEDRSVRKDRSEIYSELSDHVLVGGWLDTSTSGGTTFTGADFPAPNALIERPLVAFFIGMMARSAGDKDTARHYLEIIPGLQDETSQAMSYIRYLLFGQQYQPASLVAEAYLGTIKTPFARWIKRAVATKVGLVEQQQLARDQLIQLGQLPADAAAFSQKKLRQLAMRGGSPWIERLKKQLLYDHLRIEQDK